MANWYAGAVIYRRDAEGEIEFLVIDTRSLHPGFTGRPMQTKFVGGTEEGYLAKDVTIVGTLHRELHEETDMLLPEGYSPMVVYSETLPARKKDEPNHFKNFYLIPFEDLRGELRVVEKTIDGDWMSPPRWVRFEEACRLLYRTHQTALMKAHERLRAKAA